MSETNRPKQVETQAEQIIKLAAEKQKSQPTVGCTCEPPKVSWWRKFRKPRPIVVHRNDFFSPHPLRTPIIELATAMGARNGHAQMIAYEILEQKRIQDLRIEDTITKMPKNLLRPTQEDFGRALKLIFNYVDEEIAVETLGRRSY